MCSRRAGGVGGHYERPNLAQSIDSLLCNLAKQCWSARSRPSRESPLDCVHTRLGIGTRNVSIPAFECKSQIIAKYTLSFACVASTFMHFLPYPNLSHHVDTLSTLYNLGGAGWKEEP